MNKILLLIVPQFLNGEIYVNRCILSNIRAASLDPFKSTGPDFISFEYSFGYL